MHLREKLLYAALRMFHAFRGYQPDRGALGTAEIRRILLISCTALGDTLLSTPAFRSLRLAYPEARITLLIHPAYQELFSGHPDVDQLLPYTGRWRGFWRTARRLRKENFDLACILHGNEPQATPLAYLSGARFIFKLPNANRFRFLLTNREPVQTWNDLARELGHGIEQRLAVARLAGGRPTDRRMTLPDRPGAAAQVAEQLAKHGIGEGQLLLALQPGASTTSRRWAPERFIELGRQMLANHPDLTLVITGSPAEQTLCRQIGDAIVATGGSGRVWVCAGELPLVLLPALLARCFTVVTGDTGPMHLAITVGTPVVALFAVSDWRRSGPAYDLERHIVIQKWRTCDPCLSKRCPYPQPICMENIAVHEVREAVERQLLRARDKR
jgi:ADP-heptose:LPS heptosyltransferase